MFSDTTPPNCPRNFKHRVPAAAFKRILAMKWHCPTGIVVLAMLCVVTGGCNVGGSLAGFKAGQTSPGLGFLVWKLRMITIRIILAVLRFELAS
jgi:hypothetical protein